MTAAAHGHHIVKCKGCEKVLGQCRCAFKDKPILWGWCDECRADLDLSDTAQVLEAVDNYGAAVQREDMLRAALARRDKELVRVRGVLYRFWRIYRSGSAGASLAFVEEEIKR